MTKMYRSWLEISESSLLENVSILHKLIGKQTKLLAVLKANAYGHGLKEVSKLLNKSHQVDWFGVDNVEDGLWLRRQGVKKPILVMGYIPQEDLRSAILANLSLVISSRSSLEKINSLKLPIKAKIHLKVDTGMGRQGVLVPNVLALAKEVVSSGFASLEGVATHFASADSPKGIRDTRGQIRLFKECLEILIQNEISPGIIHASATAGLFNFPEAKFDMVRVGRCLYGIWADAPEKRRLRKLFPLKPVLIWKSMVVQTKIIPKGFRVGYGLTWRARRETLVAVIPVGYFDGYDRGLSGIGQVLIKGKLASVIGRISMNMMTVDVTDIKDVKVEDEVVLLGGKLPAERIAKQIGTISYEIVARLSSTLPRVVV